MIPAIGLLALATYIIIAVLSGKAKLGELEPMDTPAPTEDPSFSVIRSISEGFGGLYSEGEGIASASFRSAVDGESIAVSASTRSGVVCLDLARAFPVNDREPFASPTAEPTKSIFFIDQTPAPSGSPAPSESPKPFDVSRYAEELCDILSFACPPQDRNGSVRSIASALDLLANGGEKKAGVVFGFYLVEFSWSSADGMLKASCGPIAP